MSAVTIRSISSARPGSGRPRRPYSAYTRRDEEQGAIIQYDQPNSNREWWRYYLRVSEVVIKAVAYNWFVGHTHPW